MPQGIQEIAPDVLELLKTFIVLSTLRDFFRRPEIAHDDIQLLKLSQVCFIRQEIASKVPKLH